MFGAPRKVAEHVVLQAPGIGIPDMIDPALDAGVEFREGAVPVAPGFESLGQPPGGVDRFCGS